MNPARVLEEERDTLYVDMITAEKSSQRLGTFLTTHVCTLEKNRLNVASADPDSLKKGTWLNTARSTTKVYRLS